MLELAAHPTSSPSAVLTEYASYDAHLFIAAFLRRALHRVYADPATLEFRPRLQRELALRLLRGAPTISARFAWRRLADFRNDDFSAPVEPAAAHLVYLGRRAQAALRPETGALARLLQREDPAFDLRLSAFRPACFVASLDGALKDSVPLTRDELSIVFHCWTRPFEHTLRGVLLRYIAVLEGLPAGGGGIQETQDFVDTWPASA